MKRKLIALFALMVVLASCAKTVVPPVENTTQEPAQSAEGCTADSECAGGEQCIGQTCVTVVEAQRAHGEAATAGEACRRERRGSVCLEAIARNLLLARATKRGQRGGI